MTDKKQQDEGVFICPKCKTKWELKEKKKEEKFLIDDRWFDSISEEICRRKES
jgi:transcription elongation factor Elf1